MKSAICLILSFLIGACVYDGNNRLDEMARRLSSEALSPEDLIAEYGQPRQIFFHDGQQIYEYRLIKISSIPDDEYTDFGPHYTQKYVYVYFDEGIMTKIDTIFVNGKYPPDDIFADFRDKQ